MSTINGSTALMGASEQGHIGIVPLLLSAGANVNAARTDNGFTVLMSALYSGSLACVQALFKAGADVEYEPVRNALCHPECRSNSRCVTFVQQAQQARKLLADLKAFIQAGDTGAACAFISKPENVIDKC